MNGCRRADDSLPHAPPRNCTTPPGLPKVDDGHLPPAWRPCLSFSLSPDQPPDFRRTEQKDHEHFRKASMGANLRPFSRGQDPFVQQGHGIRRVARCLARVSGARSSTAPTVDVAAIVGKAASAKARARLANVDRRPDEGARLDSSLTRARSSRRNCITPRYQQHRHHERLAAPAGDAKLAANGWKLPDDMKV